MFRLMNKGMWQMLLLLDHSRKRLKADMIAGPTWVLNGRAFTAATGAARGGA